MVSCLWMVIVVLCSSNIGCEWCTQMFFFFFFNDTATTEIYTLSLHDALPISQCKPLGPNKLIRISSFPNLYQGVIDNSNTRYWLFLLFTETSSYNCYQIYVYSILKTCSHEHILDIFVYLSAVTALEL